MPTPFAPEHEALRETVRRMVDGPLADLARGAERGEAVHGTVLARCGDLGLLELDEVLAEIAACQELGRLRSGGLVALLLDVMLMVRCGFGPGEADVTVVSRDAAVRVEDGVAHGMLPFVVGGAIAGRCVVLDSGVVVHSGAGWSAAVLAAPHALRGAAPAAITLDGAAVDPFEVAPEALWRHELWSAAAAVGAAQRDFEDARAYAQQREAFGRPIARFQVNRHALAEIATHLAAAEALVEDTAWRWSQGDEVDPAAARLYAGRVATDAADRSLQLHGGNGYTTDYDAQRAWRDGRALRLTDDELRTRLETAQGTAS